MWHKIFIKIYSKIYSFSYACKEFVIFQTFFLLYNELYLCLYYQIRDVTIAGTLRLTFKPLTDELPCFRAIVYSLRDLVSTNCF